MSAKQLAENLREAAGLEEAKKYNDKKFMKMSSDAEKKLIKCVKYLKDTEQGGMSSAWLAEMITNLRKIDPGLPKWVKYHIKS